MGLVLLPKSGMLVTKDDKKCPVSYTNQVFYLTYRTFGDVGAGNGTDTCSLEANNKYFKELVRKGKNKSRLTIADAITEIPRAVKVCQHVDTRYIYDRHTLRDYS